MVRVRVINCAEIVLNDAASSANELRDSSVDVTGLDDVKTGL